MRIDLRYKAAKQQIDLMSLESGEEATPKKKGQGIIRIRIFQN